MKYRQCELRETGGTVETVGWIEERGAKAGARVEMKDFGGKLFDVVKVYSKAFEADALREKQQNDRNAFGSIM